MIFYLLILILAEANAFSLLNDTYEQLHGDEVTGVALDFFSRAIALLGNFKFYFIIITLVSFYLATRLIFKVFFTPFYMLYRILRPCCQIMRYHVLQGTAMSRNTMWAQGDETTPGCEGISKSIDQACPSSTAMKTIIDGNPPLVSESKPPKLVDATVVGEDTDCNKARNTMFSGETITSVMSYRRRRPPSDMMYRANTSEYNTNAKVDSFIFSNAALVGYLVYESSISSLITASPKFNFLRTLWTYYRFGVKITIQPTVNPMASGVLAVSVSSYPNSVTLTPAARDTWFANLGAFNPVFIQCSANQHAEIVVPDVVLDRWLNNEYIGGSSVSTLTSFTLGRLGIFVVCPYSTNTGGPSSLRYNVHIQLVDVHCKWPQVARFLTQGIIDFNTSVNVIDKMTNSSLPVDISGGSGAISASGFGMDLPSDTRQYDYHVRRVFQKMYPTRGKMTVNRLTFNQSDSASYPFIGDDQMSLSWLMSKRNYWRDDKFTSSDVADSLIFSGRMISPQPTTIATINGIQDVLMGMGLYCEFDAIVFTFIVPKVPYQNGKYLVTLVSGLASIPSTINTSTFNMTSAPSLIIDLSAPDVAHEFRVPFTLLSEFFPAGFTQNHMRHAVPRIAMYCLNPISTNLMAPSSITCTTFQHFENFRTIYPSLNMSTQGGDCVSTGARVAVPNDNVFTRKTDDAISIKQYMTPSVLALTREIKVDAANKECNISMTYSALIGSMPFGPWYRFYNGSLRLGVQVIPYFDGAPTDRVEQVLLTFGRRGFISSSTTPASVTTSPFSKLINDLPVVSGNLVELKNFQADITAVTGGAYVPGYPQFPILLDLIHERMTHVELPLLGPNGYIDMWPIDTVSKTADEYGFTMSIDPIFRGSFIDGIIFKVLLWVSAGDDLQAWGLNPMGSGTQAAIASVPKQTVAGSSIETMPWAGIPNYVY